MLKSILKRITPTSVLLAYHHWKATSSTVLQETEIVREALRDNGIKQGVYLDVGGHYGLTCLPYANDSFRCLVFEPSFENRKFLNLVASKRTNIEVYPLAISSEKGFFDFYESAVSSGISSLNKFHATHKVVGSVRTCRLDDVLPTLMPPGDIEVLKIDVEGYEYSVFQGFEKVCEYSPKIIIAEFDDFKIQGKKGVALDLVRWLEGHGYDVYFSVWEKADRYGGRHQWRQYTKTPPRFSDPKVWGNIVAIRSGLPALTQTVTDQFNKQSS